MEDLVILLIWGACGYGCYAIAKSKNRNKGLWAILGVLFGIFAVIIISLLPNLPA